MNLQLFPDSCGWEVAKAWCPITDLHTWIGILFFYLIGLEIYFYFKYFRRKNEKD
jgi:hypothetical protein